jgi:hypothetical protein
MGHVVQCCVEVSRLRVFLHVGSARLCMCSCGITLAAQGVRSCICKSMSSKPESDGIQHSSHFTQYDRCCPAHSHPTSSRVSERVTDADQSMHTQLKSHSHSRRCTPRTQARDAAHTRHPTTAPHRRLGWACMPKLFLTVRQHFSCHEQLVQPPPAANHARPQQDAFSMHPHPPGRPVRLQD